MSEAPRDSAAVVVLRNPRAPEVFWARRSDTVPYQPGFQSFLGGRLHPSDTRVAIEGVPEGPPRWMRACAIREALEEAGVLLGANGPVRPDDVARGQAELLSGEADLATLAARFGWRFDGSRLVETGRWVTPPFAAMRFDTWYFLTWLPDGQQAAVQPGELAQGEWVRPADALERWRRGEVTFVAPILSTLREVGRGLEGLEDRLRALPEVVTRRVRRIEMKWGVLLWPQQVRTLPPATHTNCYLVGDREVAMIDPGSEDAEQLATLLELVEEVGREGRRVTCVLLTHGHPDHVGGVETVRSRLGVPVLGHAGTARFVRLDRTLQDGEVVPLAGEAHDFGLRAVHTPGHARGHLCFLHEPTRSLFTGDHVVGAGTVVIDPPEGDMAEYMTSLERLLALPVETLFPGHGSPRGGARVALRALLAHRREREAKVLAAVEAGGTAGRTAAELLPIVYADTPGRMWPWARRSLQAHLEKLEREGRVGREGERFAGSQRRNN